MFVPKVLLNLTQYQIIMDTLDSHYAVEIKELIFTEYNNNKFIDVQIYYFLNGDNKYNIL